MNSRTDPNDAIYYAKLVNFDRSKTFQTHPSLQAINIFQDLTDSHFFDQVNQQHLILQQEKQRSLKTKRLTLSQQKSKKNSMNQIYRDNLNNFLANKTLNQTTTSSFCSS